MLKCFLLEHVEEFTSGLPQKVHICSYAMLAPETANWLP